MRHSMILGILLLGLHPVGSAEDGQPFEWTRASFDFVATGDAKQGEALADQYRCAKCHNDNGISDDPEIPSIAGQRATYFYKQLQDFKGGVRDNRDMYKATRKLSDDDMAHLATWFSTLDRADMVGGAPMLVMKECDSCHDNEIIEEDNTIEVAPIIRGQVRAYLETSMQQFRDVSRANDLFKRMQSVTHKLEQEEIVRLARFYGAADPE
jgi:cytochrome c553